MGDLERGQGDMDLDMSAIMDAELNMELGVGWICAGLFSKENWFGELVRFIRLDTVSIQLDRRTLSYG